LRVIDILVRLAERSDVTVHLSLITVDAPLLRKLEVRSPAPTGGCARSRSWRGANLNAGVMIAPVLRGSRTTSRTFEA